MAANQTNYQIDQLLEGLSHREAKKREAAALQIAKTPTANRQVIERLKVLAQTDARDYVRVAAQNALAETANGYERAAAELRGFLLSLKAQPAPDAAKSAAAPVTEETAAQVDPVSAKPQPALVPAENESAVSVIPSKQVFAAESAPPAPPVPFDQWLLSERNIKLALYSGGALLVLAALIFVGVNWNHLDGIAKLGITAGLTAVLYAIGAFFFSRSTLKIGGVALLAIASAFLPLNFVVTQLYLTSATLQWTSMWLIASVVCGIVYTLIVWRTRHELFTWFGVVALYSALAALSNLVPSSWDPYYLRFGVSVLAALVTFGLLFLARRVRETPPAGFIYRPFLIASHIMMPLLCLAALYGLFIPFINPYAGLDLIGLLLDLIVIAIGIGFYIYFDFGWHKPWSRSVAALLYAVTAIVTVGALRLDELASGVILMLVALSLLGAGWWFQQRGSEKVVPQPKAKVQNGAELAPDDTGKPARGQVNALAYSIPIYLLGYTVAALVTYRASTHWQGAPLFLALALTADVALLAVSWLLFRRPQWIYATVLSAIVPVGTFAYIYLGSNVAIGLVLAGLMVLYAAVGLYFCRAGRVIGDALLAGAVALTVIVPILTLLNLPATAGVLALGAVVYLAAALAFKREWLLVPALVAGNLAAMALTFYFVPATLPSILSIERQRALLILFAGLGIALLVGGILLRLNRASNWRMPLYAIAGVDLALALFLGLIVGLTRFAVLSDQILGLVVTLLCVVVSFAMLWVERELLSQVKVVQLLGYAAAGLLLLGAYQLVSLLPIPREYHVVVIALCAGLMVGAGIVLWRDPLRVLYGMPLRYVGYVGLALAALTSPLLLLPVPVAATFAIVGFVLLAEGIVRRLYLLYYAAALAFVVVLWALLWWNRNAELQLFALPLGVVLLAIGWNERRANRCQSFTFVTVSALIILMGTAFYQSFNNVYYALLLFVESALAVGLGVFLRSKVFVSAGILALVLNGLVQFGPAILQIDRWIQVGAIGTLLLGMGILALFRRERLLLARQSVAERWRGLKP